MKLEPHIKINSSRIAEACTIFNNYTFMHYTHVLTNGLFGIPHIIIFRTYDDYYGKEVKYQKKKKETKNLLVFYHTHTWAQ